MSGEVLKRGSGGEVLARGGDQDQDRPLDPATLSPAWRGLVSLLYPYWVPP